MTKSDKIAENTHKSPRTHNQITQNHGKSKDHVKNHGISHEITKDRTDSRSISQNRAARPNKIKTTKVTQTNTESNEIKTHARAHQNHNKITPKRTNNLNHTMSRELAKCCTNSLLSQRIASKSNIIAKHPHKLPQNQTNSHKTAQNAQYPNEIATKSRKM